MVSPRMASYFGENSKSFCATSNRYLLSELSNTCSLHFELVRNHVPSWKDAQERGFQILPYSNIPNTTNIYVFVLFTGVEGRSPEYEEPQDLRSNPFQGGGNDAILPYKSIGQKTPSRLCQRSKGRPQGSHEPQGRFRAHGLSMSPLIFVNIRIGFSFVWALYSGHSSSIGFQPCISEHFEQSL